MRIYYPVIFAGVVIVLIMCANAARKSNKKIGKAVERLMVSSAVIVFAQIMMVAVPNYWTYRVFNNLYFMSIDWTLYFVLVFCYEYTHQELKGAWWDYVIRIFVLVDTVCIIANIFLEYLTKVESIEINGQTYYNMVLFKPYQGHLFLCYILFMIGLLAIIRKLVNTASVYWGTYILIALSLLIIVGVNLVYLITDSVVDYSIIGYAAGGFLIYYFSIKRKPIFIINNMLSAIIREMDDGVVLFDMDGDCVYANQNARDLLRVEHNDYDKCEEELLNWLQEGNRYKTNDVFLEDTFVRMINGKKISLKITSKTLIKGTHDIGVCYQITNFSKEVELHKKERYMAFHDSLTGVYNRAGLFDIIEKRIRENPEKRYYLLALDIRDFKGVNDILGRKSGDELLIRVAKQLESLDSLDAIYGRLIGDKFGILLEREKFHARKISKLLNNMKFVETETSYMIVMHMGIYEIQEDDP
ncbi:MAG: diguanylate cyclase, partial [Lachnospiraceae bacterium]|nr:diguanylate cyclase [Lachnospiraceae bacterium]